jgi:hypothetical protein
MENYNRGIKYLSIMNLQENINRIKEMMGIISEDNSKKDLSLMIRESLNTLIERKKHIVCDIEVTAPWNRETIEPDKSFKHYKVLVTFIGGYGTRYFPLTQWDNQKYDDIMDEVWHTVFDYFGEPTDVYKKNVKHCSNTEKEEQTENKDPKTGTGKKPEGSDRRLYTDENPSDTVSVKFRTKQDIIDTLNKESFKSKPHNRQSQIINLIHQRLRVALERAKDPEVKKRLRTAFEYIESKKEESKKKTQEMKEGELTERCWKGYTQKGMKTMFGKRYPNCVKIKK